MANIENNESNYDRVIETSIEDVIHNSMIPYAEYVILDRAIPRVEDGLKPVQRRILYAMYELGITPEKPTRKSARIVGDCLGKFHPHGDTSVYGALVRMGQPFSIRNCLIEGQGNFGSVDGDSAAAMRYTEARLTPLAMELLRDIDKNTVEFTNNFDDTLIEPVTLPGRFPNLLVNGASGIAVGLATNIPTHNLAEVIEGTIAMIKKPTISLAELMKYIPAPDFPTGGYIIKTDLEKAYETGRGKIMIRAKANIEKEKDKEMIVITELPYQVNKAVVQQKIIALRESQKDSKDSVILGINEVVDESDMNGTRVVIRVKKDYNCREILAELFRKTDLEVSFNINMVAIANGKPKTMSIIEILTAYIKYQMSVILRRAKYDYD
ncbi:MAG: DNA gyrase subunit A, partial [Clostridia bacterium]